MSIHPKRKIILSLLLFGVALAAFVFFVILPTFRGVVGDHEELLSQMRSLALMDMERTYIKDFKELSSRHQTEFAKIDELFVNLDNPIDFFKSLEETADAARLSLRITPSLPRKIEGNPWPSIDLQLSGVGFYPSIVRFLGKLEHAPYLMEVKNTGLTRLNPEQMARNAKEPGDTNFSILLKVYIK